MHVRLGLIILLPAMLVAFQNCGKVAAPSGEPMGGPGDSKSQTVIGSTASYKKIVYSPLLEFNGSAGGVSLDIDTGIISLSIAGTTKSCTLDTVRLSGARQILQTSEVCRPGPLPPGMVSCLAIGAADIELSNATALVQLRPVICNSGTFLCDGNDALLRSLISDLETNPPAGCVGN
jgi:hypothetical protein